MNKSTVDIIIPCYNTGRYLRQAIDSALAQTYPYINVLVVDDGSTDDTKGIVESYRGRVGYFYQENKGLPAARNAGISRTHGEFVCLLDADDVILPHMIQDQLKEFEQNAGVDITHGKTLFFCADDIALPRAEGRPHRQWSDYVQPFSVTCAVHLGSSLIRRNCFQRFGLFTQELTEQGCEDWAFWLCCAMQGAVFKYVPRVHGLYRQHGGSMSSSELAVARRESELVKLAARMLEGSGACETKRLRVLCCGIKSIGALWLPLGKRERFQELLDLSNRLSASLVDSSQVGDSFPYSSETHPSVIYLALSKEFFDLGLPDLAIFMFLKCGDIRKLEDESDQHGQSELFEQVVDSVERAISDNGIQHVSETCEIPSTAHVEAERALPLEEGPEFYFELERTIPHHASFHGYVRHQLGLLAESRGDLETAEKELRIAVQLNPKFLFSRVALAHILDAKRDYASAEQELMDCLALDPGFALGILDHAKVLARMGRYGRAVSAFVKGSRIEPGTSMDYVIGWLKSILRKRPSQGPPKSKAHNDR